MKKVKYIGYGFYTLITHNKVYDVVEANIKDDCILIINDFGGELWYLINRSGNNILFEDVTLEYDRDETITEILS